MSKVEILPNGIAITAPDGDDLPVFGSGECTVGWTTEYLTQAILDGMDSFTDEQIRRIRRAIGDRQHRGPGT